jgi:hypothetical protein
MALTKAGQIRSSLGSSWVLPFHQIISTLGVMVLAGFLAFATSSASRARWILTETPYFPVQIGLAFVIGVALQRCLRHRIMQWVWVLPSLILLVSFILTPLPFVGRLQHYFGRGCKLEFRCFVQLSVTLPFYAAASYSLAAFLSRILHRRLRQHEAANIGGD